MQDGPGLHRLAQAIEADGHGVSWDRELPGVERFYVDDPWGNRLEVVSG